MRRLLFFLVPAFSLWLGQAGADAPRPNILLIMADDLGCHFGNNRAIRQGDWKLTSARGGPWELYDLKSDRTELHDLAKSDAGRAAQLESLWHRIAKDTDRLPEKLRQPARNMPDKRTLKEKPR